jgi:hypothetical protein
MPSRQSLIINPTSEGAARSDVAVTGNIGRIMSMPNVGRADTRASYEGRGEDCRQHELSC